MDAAYIDRIVAALGGWPDYLTGTGQARGESMMAVVIERRIVDQAVFVLVCRWAVHMAAFDRLSGSLVAAEAAAAAAGGRAKAGAAGDAYLSGDEQRRAYHENRAAALETQLLATPYQRMKAGLTAQTSFLDQLAAPDPATPAGNDAGGARKVMPFAPRARKNGH